MKRTLALMFCAVSLGLAAQSFTPTKKVMIEDHTTGGAWFGWWSPRGIVFLEQFMMTTLATDYEVACIHGNGGADYENGNFDAMYLPSYSDAAVNTDLMTGWPCFLLDRKESSSYEAETTLPTRHEAISDDFGYANLTIEPIFDSYSRSLTVVTNVHFAVDASNFRLALVLTEDSVHQPGVDGYSQTNAYNFINGDAADTPMASSSVDFNAQGPVVPSDLMTFRHVARSIIPSYEGEPSSLPTEVWADGQYSFTFPTQVIPQDYDETKMRAIVLLINGSNGEVVNCLGADFNETETSNSYGCTDALACNYDPDAVDDDGTCDFTSCASCTDPSACNFNASASFDDGSCDYSCCPGPGCCGEGTTWDELSQTCVSECSGNACDLVYDGNEDGIVGSGDLLGLLTEFGAECTSETVFTCGDPVNHQGYDYETVQIGEQCWFAENVRYLPAVSPPTLGSEDDNAAHAYVYGYTGNSTIEASQQYEYQIAGALYNQNAVQDWGLCPVGWHVPSAEEIISLSNVYGGLNAAGGALKNVELESPDGFGWQLPNTGATNVSGFSAQPTGARNALEVFTGWSNFGYWRTTTEENGNGVPWHFCLAYYDSNVTTNCSANNIQGREGYSVRCLRNND